MSRCRTETPCGGERLSELVTPAAVGPSKEIHGRTALLSPFDNLVSDRRLTERLWDFEFRDEMYVPKAKRKHDYYLLPILHQDLLVGRVSPRFERTRGALVVEGVRLEPEVTPTAELGRAVLARLEDLAAFGGATRSEYGETLPPPWVRWCAGPERRCHMTAGMVVPSDSLSRRGRFRCRGARRPSRRRTPAGRRGGGRGRA